MKKDKKIEVLDAIRAHYKFKTNREFADFLGVSAAVLSNWYNRGTFDYDIILGKCTEIDFNKLLREASVAPDRPAAPQPENGGLLHLLATKDRQIIELSEKIGTLKEQIRQLKK